IISRTDSSEASALLCSTMPIRDRHSRPPSPGSVPGAVASPPSRRRYPSRISTVVVLPAPFGPSSANTSPWLMSRSTPSTATVSPYDLRSPLTRTLVVESMDQASGPASPGTTTARPVPPSTVRWTRSGFLHAADGVGQGADHVARPDRRFPAGERAGPARCVSGRNTVQERRDPRGLADAKPLGEQRARQPREHVAGAGGGQPPRAGRVDQ